MPGGGGLFRKGKKKVWSKTEVKAAKPARKPEEKKKREKRKRKEEEDPSSEEEEDPTSAIDNNMNLPTYRDVKF